MEKETCYSSHFLKNLILNIKKPTDKTNKSNAEHFARANCFQKPEC